MIDDTKYKMAASPLQFRPKKAASLSVPIYFSLEQGERTSSKGTFDIILLSS